MNNTIEVLRQVDNLWEIAKVNSEDVLAGDILLDENFQEQFANVKWTEDKKVKTFLTIFLGTSLIVWIIGLILLPEGDRILAIPAYASVGLAVVWLIDKYALKNVDLIYEFKQKNYNVGLWLIAILNFVGYVIGVIS